MDKKIVWRRFVRDAFAVHVNFQEWLGGHMEVPEIHRKRIARTLIGAHDAAIENHGCRLGIFYGSCPQTRFDALALGIEVGEGNDANQAFHQFGL